MKFTILLEILFDLLAKRKLTAAYLAEKYEISQRTVYRYIDLLSMSVPIYIKRGRNGGICISDNYKLPVGFMTKEEYASAIEALEAMYSQLPEERFLAAKRKLSAQTKSETRELVLSGEIGTILVDGGAWGDTRAFSDRAFGTYTRFVINNARFVCSVWGVFFPRSIRKNAFKNVLSNGKISPSIIGRAKNP